MNAFRVPGVARIRVTAVERSTASDHRRTAPPRGIVNVDDRMRACARQRAEGVSTADLAKLYGVTRAVIYGWCAKVEQAEADERNMRGA